MAKDGPTLVIVQAPPVYLNLAGSVERAAVWIERAAEEGADIVVFGESWLPGYPVWIDEAPGAARWGDPGAKALYRILSENAVTPGDTNLARLGEAAAASGTYVVIGAHERRGGTLYNSCFLFAPDGRAALHRKLVPTYGERLVWGMGDGATLAPMETPFGALGGLICWEHWMPLLRAAMHAQEEAIHIAQWPTVNEMHRIASRHYAFEGRCVVAAAGCLLTKADMMEGLDSLGPVPPEARDLLDSVPGTADTLLQRGGSCIIGPDGAFLAEPVFEREAIVSARIDLGRLAEERLTLDTSGHYGRPDIFDLKVDTRPRRDVRFESGDPARDD